VFDIAIWLSITIFFVAIVLWASIKYRYLNPKLNDIRTAIEALQQSEPVDLKDFEQIMVNNETLSSTWRSFQHTLYSDQYRTIATRRASDFFNELVIDSGKFDLRIASAIPGYLLSTGLMFTFIGLLLALNAAVTLSQAGDINASTLALQGLLGAAAFKFLTSITGLLCSILFSIALRSNMQQARNLLDVLCDEIDSQLDFETSEIITLRQIEEARVLNTQLINANQQIADHQQSMTHQLMNSITQLQQSIGENRHSLTLHANTFEQSISQLLLESKNLNTHLISDMRQANHDSLNLIVNEFTNKFHQETKKQFKEINQQLGQTQKHFNQITSNLLAAGNQFKSDIRYSGIEIREKITEASATLNKGFSASAKSMIDTTSNMENILNSLHKVMNNLLSGTEAILEANKNIGPVSERFEIATRDFVAIVPEISGLTHHFKKFYSIFNEFNSNMRTIDKTKVRELSELIEFSRQSTELVNDYQQSSLSVNKELRESIEAFHQLILTLDQDLKVISSSTSTAKKWNQIN